MLLRSEFMLALLRKAVCILVIVCLVSQSSAKPALEYLFERIDSDDPPPYIQCRTSSDCHNKDKCCNIGRQRFSIPQCSPYGEEGDFCFPGAVAVSKNLSYPDGATVYYKGVFDMVCPCAMGHNCDPNTSQCVKNFRFIEGKNSLHTNFRTFNNDYNYQDD